MKIGLQIFRIYRVFISPALQAGFGIRCRFHESCSAFAERTLTEMGFRKALPKIVRRFISCNPLGDPSNG